MKLRRASRKATKLEEATKKSELNKPILEDTTQCTHCMQSELDQARQDNAVMREKLMRLNALLNQTPRHMIDTPTTAVCHQARPTQ